MAEFGVVEAPSSLGLWPSGVQDAPRVLLEMGLGTALSAAHLGRVEPEAYDPRRDPSTLILNAPSIALYATRLDAVVSEALGKGVFPIVLGGDCSILLGPALALKRRGRYGLLFVDGHMDYYAPEREPYGEAASMDLALASGRGPDKLTNIDGLRPYFRVEDCVAYGVRDHIFDPDFVAAPFPTPVSKIDLTEVREQKASSIRKAIGSVTHEGMQGFWIHLDVDAIADESMPAVDYRMPGGLTFIELGELLREAIDSGKATGMTITIYNPNLDPSRRIARALVDCLVSALNPLGGDNSKTATARESL